MRAYARMRGEGKRRSFGNDDGEGATNTLHIQRTGIEVWAGERFGDGLIEFKDKTTP